ncbi:uncharacterized protein VTP21DRAFT_2777 [Calcarisporiella thermophila]|uniref:uncharacterized protein n=1 Tax=Calcarisporiella thermophila TaxID=911321 RepID=UPI0037444A93
MSRRSSTTTNVGDAPWKVQNADELFYKYSVPELRAMEKKMRADIDQKKKDLRLMVGERYRDIISAADAIVAMQKNINSTQDVLASMQSGCDVHEIRRRAKILSTNKENRVDEDEIQHSLYAAAAQIKVLVDVPEQIWRALEDQKYLLASRLYLLAKAVYKNLQSEKDDMPISIANTFPVVQRQWDVVSHFKGHILQRSIAFLKLFNTTAKSVAETLAAIMLLDNYTMKDTVKLLLEMRTSALADFFDKPFATNNPADTPASRLASMVRLFKATVSQVTRICIQPMLGESESQLMFDAYLQQLRVGFTMNEELDLSPIQNRDYKSISMIPRLYSPTANVHLLVRYLPESVHSYTPCLNETPFTADDARRAVGHWVNLAKEEFEQKLERFLASVAKSCQELAALRKGVWDVLGRADDMQTGIEARDRRRSVFMRIRESRSPRWSVYSGDGLPMTWKQICEVSLGAEFFIWASLFRQSFHNHFQTIVNSSLSEIAAQPCTILRHALFSARENDWDVGRFVWSPLHEEVRGTGPLMDTDGLRRLMREWVGADTPTVKASRMQFDRAIEHLLSDVKCGILFEGEDGDLLQAMFSARSDSQSLSEYFQDRWLATIRDYCDGLKAMLEELSSSHDPTQQESYDKTLLLGRISQTLGTRSEQLPGVLTQIQQYQKQAAGRMVGSGYMAKLEPDSRTKEVQAMFMSLYASSQQSWIEALVREASEAIETFLCGATWNDTDALMHTWEATAIQTSEHSEGETVQLPASVSRAILKALVQLCKRLNRAGSATLQPEAVASLSQRLCSAFLASYRRFLEKIALEEEEHERKAEERKREYELSKKQAEEREEKEKEEEKTVEEKKKEEKTVEVKKEEELKGSEVKGESEGEEPAQNTEKKQVPEDNKDEAEAGGEKHAETIQTGEQEEEVGAPENEPESNDKAGASLHSGEPTTAAESTVEAEKGADIPTSSENIPNPEETGADEALENRLTEKGALQMLFDIKYLAKVFEGHLATETGLTDRGSMEEVARHIQQKIDPINLAFFEPQIVKNSQRNYARTCVLFGLLVQTNPPPQESDRRGHGIHEIQHIQAPRFSLFKRANV